MSAALTGPLAKLLTVGFEATLAPLGFEPNHDRRTWVRRADEIDHVIALLKRRDSFDVQWGLVSPELVGIMWDEPYASHNVGQAIVSGTPSTIRHPARAQSFDRAALEAETARIVAGVREDLTVVEAWMRPFRTRTGVCSYLLENRERTDRRAFVIPAKLPLKLFTAAALAVVDGAPTASELVSEAEAALAPFKGDVTAGRLARLKARADSTHLP